MKTNEARVERLEAEAGEVEELNDSIKAEIERLREWIRATDGEAELSSIDDAVAAEIARGGPNGFDAGEALRRFRHEQTT